MKKYIAVLVTAATIAAASYADSVPTLADIRADYEASLVIAATNLPAASSFANRRVIVPLHASRIYKGADADSLAGEADAKYASLGIGAPWTWATAVNDSRFTKSALVSFNKHGVATNSPYVVSLGRKKSWYCGPCNYNANNATVEELVLLLNENVDLVNGKCRPGYSYKTIDRLRKHIQAASVKPVKKWLRRQGKSFVTKDGVNPCETAMADLNTALNAAYFSGLNEWLANVGVNASVDTSKLPPAAEVAELKNAILDADKDLKPEYEFILKVGLGVDGYNSFVKEYNGDK